MKKNWLNNAFTANLTTYRDDAIDALAYYLYNDSENTNDCFEHFAIKPMSRTIKKVIFNDPATIVIWSDNTKTVVKCCKDEKFDPEKGLAMVISKRVYGDNFKKIFKKWVPEEIDVTHVGMSLSEFATRMNKIFIPTTVIEKINKKE